MVFTWLCSFFWAGVVATQSRPYRYHHVLSIVLIFTDIKTAHMDGQQYLPITADETRGIATLAVIIRPFTIYEANAVYQCNFSIVHRPDHRPVASKDFFAIGLDMRVTSLRVFFVPESCVVPDMPNHSALEITGEGGSTVLVQWSDTAGTDSQPGVAWVDGAVGLTQTPLLTSGSSGAIQPPDQTSGFETDILGKPMDVRQQVESTAAGPEIAELE